MLSGGLPMAIFLPLMTIGRSIREGFSAISCSHSSPLRLSSLDSPNSLNFLSFARTRSTGSIFSPFATSANSCFERGVFKYWIMSNSILLSFNTSSVCRLLLHFGLCKIFIAAIDLLIYLSDKRMMSQMSPTPMRQESLQETVPY